MTDKEIQEHYDLVADMHLKFLVAHGVKLPGLRDANGNYSKNALVLVKLAKGYPNTETVSKSELTKFMQKFYPDTVDVQQGRHLSMQSGWNIVSGTRGDRGTIPSGSYKLIDLKTPYPAFAGERRAGFDGDFDEIKKQYDYRCATCGSHEGQDHLFRSGVKVKLQEGHMDSGKPLVAGNIIPQCQICNRPDRNRWIYDKTGRVIEIAQTNDGIRVVETFLQNASPDTRKKIFEFLKKIDNG